MSENANKKEYIALYRKWRPSVFSDVIGQDHITKVLRSEVEHSSVSHAYIFCGSRGTGKTTCAKILAKAVNCESPVNGDPCGKCRNCLAFENSYDILEMDAASNNSVENIRDLCDKVAFMPFEMKKRVYIIDEVHMLSKGAFNALLKTLEEPPSHVMFILATTELNKIPATILSRCKRFDFHRISVQDMLPRLKYIAGEEKIGITDDALNLIAFLASGAMRDALSMLELFVGKTGIDRNKAAQSLGIVGNGPVLELLSAVAKRDGAKALGKLSEIYKSSKDMGVLCSELARMFRNLLIMKYASNSVSSLIDTEDDVISALRNCENDFSKERLIYSLEITEQAQNKLTKNGLSERTVMELALIKLCDARFDNSYEALLERISEMESGIAPKPSFAPEIAEKPAENPKKAAEKPAKEENTPAPQAEEIPEPVEEIPEPVEMPVEAPVEVPEEQESPKARPEEPKVPLQDGEGVEMLAFGELLDELQKKDMICYSMLKDSRALIFGNTLKIYVPSITRSYMANYKDKSELIESISSKLLGMKVNAVFAEIPKKQSSSLPQLDLFSE